MGRISRSKSTGLALASAGAAATRLNAPRPNTKTANAEKKRRKRRFKKILRLHSDIAQTKGAAYAWGRCIWPVSAALFDVSQARAEDFFDAPQLRAPVLPHIVEAPIDMRT